MNQKPIIVKPELPTPFPPTNEYWTDSITGLKVPKTKEKNLEWRMKMLEQAESDSGMQRDLLSACAASLLFWINAFGMTYKKWDVHEDGNRTPAINPNEPMITWPIQDILLFKLQKNYAEGKDLLIDKSRDMGATYSCVFFFHWLVLFKEHINLGELSRNEKCVDWEGDMDGLFQKHDYINKWLPEWMQPPECFLGQTNRKHLNWSNPFTGSSISGESTTKHAGRSSRRDIQLLDEFGACQNGAQIRAATRDTALMRIINSTPVPGSEYNAWKNDGTVEVFVLPWWEHPEKGVGRHIVQEESGKWKIRSPWYDVEYYIRGAKYMAAEVDREDIEPGLSFFSKQAIETHMALYCKPPKSVWDIRFTGFLGDKEIQRVVSARKNMDFHTLMWHIEETPKGPLKLWCDLKNGRPDQKYNYIFGIDTGKGMGASNSVISIKCQETGEKVGEWACAQYPPYEFAQIIVAVALWFGGNGDKKLPFLKWENNGPGWDLGRILVKRYYYPYYYRAQTLGKITDRTTSQYGRQTSRQSKYELLAIYDKFLAHGGYINRSHEALEEALIYIYYPGGGIGPATMLQESDSAKKTNGDRVIADALTLDDKDIIKRNDKKKLNFGPRYRFEQFQKKTKIKSKPGRKKFDFTMMVN